MNVHPTHILALLFTMTVASTPAVATESVRYALSDVAEQSLPSVVTVLSTRNLLSGGGNSGWSHPFFRSPKRGFKSQGLGSGVIVSANGLILTNNHVIEDADSLRVRLHDGREMAAEVVGSDPRTDIAVIRAEGENLTPAAIGDSDSLRIAEVVLCVGSPLSEELGHTVTQGIVSAIGRSAVGLAEYEDFIQTDAAINPGNSGGPMLNLDGEVVGINTAIASRSGGNQGIGFAVPSNMAKRVMDQLVQNGSVVRGWLGVVIQDLNEELAEALKLKQSRGVLITDVAKGSPANEARLLAGDVVVKLQNTNLENVRELRTAVAQTPPGTSVSVTLLRDGKTLERTVKIGVFPGDQQTASKRKKPKKEQTVGLERLGVRLSSLSAAKRESSGIGPSGPGLEVTRIQEDSLAESAGLQEGDVLVELNRKPVRKPREVNQIIKSLDSGATLLFRVKRGKGSLFLAVRIP